MKTHKYFFVAVLLACLPVTAFCQAPDVDWQQCYGYIGGQHDDAVVQIKPRPDGSYMACGRTHHLDGNNQPNYDCWLAHLSATGAVLWEQSYGGPGDEGAYSFDTTGDGGFILTCTVSEEGGQVQGMHLDSNNVGSDVWVVKTDSLGTLQWAHCYGGTNADQVPYVISTLDGGALFVAWTHSNDGDVSGNHGNFDAWAVKLNETGAIEWQHCLGGSKNEGVRNVIQTADSGYLITGFSGSDDGDLTLHYGPVSNTSSDSFDAWAVKLDESGTIQWQHIYGGTGQDELIGILPIPGSGYLFSGITNSANYDISGGHGGYDMWLARTDDTGRLLWSRCYGGTADDGTVSAINRTYDGNYFFAGYSYSNNGDATGNQGGADGWILKADTSGNVLWQEEVGGTDYDIFSGSCQTVDSGYIACGVSRSPSSCNSLGTRKDGWVVKLGKDALGISNTDFKNHIKVFPTVTTGTITIEYPATIAKPAIHLYNSVGQQVPFSMADEQEGKSITIASQPAGGYLLQVSGVGGSATFRILYQP